MSQIFDKVQEIIAEKLDLEAGEISTESNFINDLGADSLDTVEIIMEFEREFDISIPDDDAKKITTVGEAVLYLDGAVN
jgi:acyl carrier protein